MSIDDFGAGQSSPGYPAQLPMHELKVDKAFVMAMDREPRNAAIVGSVIDLGHNLRFSVTAEGVETSAVLAELTVGPATRNRAITSAAPSARPPPASGCAS